MILAVSHSEDDHATAVLSALEHRRHPVVLVDTAQFPSRASLTQRFGTGDAQYEMTIQGRPVDLSECRVGWWRRPLPFTLEAGISPDSISFTYTECHEAIAGLWAALGLAWVNPPDLDEMAHHKPYQLAAATEVGLPIPRTVITNDPQAAREIIGELGPGRTVYKTFLASQQCWRETRVVRPEETALLDRVRLAPVIFQEYVQPSANIRATVIGPNVFAAAIHSAPGGYDVDYRMDLAGARFEPTTLPQEIEDKIQALMRRLGLIYGAVDLLRTQEGAYVFLEVNPAGEWLFVEERTCQPITQAMAELLVRMDRQ